MCSMVNKYAEGSALAVRTAAFACPDSSLLFLSLFYYTDIHTCHSVADVDKMRERERERERESER